MFMNQTEEDSILNRLNAALNYKTEQRCADLTVLIERASRKELQSFFPILVDSIFGAQGTLGWGLRSLVVPNTYLISTEFSVLHNFLKPQGPMFKLIYCLLQDPTVKFDFNISFLPSKIRQMLHTNVHPFYSEVVQLSIHTARPLSLHMNPFDYYIFHFAYHLINPCQQRSANDSQWNTIYYNLCVDYILHFFPLNHDIPILPTIQYYTGKNLTNSVQHLNRPTRQSTLLKANLFGDPIVKDINSMHQQFEKHPRNEIWRSETILTAFTDLWLTNDQICMHYETLNLSTGAHSELPSSDYIRIVRMIVKHFHAFAASGKYDHSYLGELKKITIPMVQSRMYVFLRNILHRWPLDESFRLVLELWLSFIQPWRYSTDFYMQNGVIRSSAISANRDIQNIEDLNQKYPDLEYATFIAENLLAYVVIFQQLLPRFTRVDLSTPKNSQMLYRLTKVFNQPNLVHLIQQVEASVENKNYSPTHVFNTSYSTNMPPLSPTATWSTNTSGLIYDSTHIETPKKTNEFVNRSEFSGAKYLPIVRQKIYELEGPNFYYKPLFTGHAAPEVYELLHLIKSAELRAQRHLRDRLKQKQASSIFSFFYPQQIVDDFTLLDRQKTPMYLKCSIDYLIEIFRITDFDNFDITPTMLTEPQTAANCITTPPGGLDNSFPQVLTPERVRERVRNLIYEGDPDLIPVRSYENKFLVRTLYQLAKKINDNHYPLICSLYYNDGFVGKVARNFIQEPRVIFRYEKSFGKSNRIPEQLPARVSFRSFAAHTFLMYLFFGTLFFKFLGYDNFTFILLNVLVYFTYIFFKSIFATEPPRVQAFDLSMEE